MMNNKKGRKCYAYGSMVRKPMQQGGMMQSAMMNPMEQRQQQGMNMMAYGGKNKKKFPDLNKDGKVTKADILKGRGVV